MAGIGFELRRMLRKDTLLGLVQAYAYASVIGSGPWVLSIVGILLIGIFSASVVIPGSLVTQFQTSVTYLVACSLIYTGLVQLAFTRFISDRLFEKRKDMVLPNLHGLLVLVLLGACLARLGRKTLLVELDSGLRSVDIIAGVYGRTVYDIEDVLCGRCEGAKAVVPSPLYPGLSVISAPYEGGAVEAAPLGRLLTAMRPYFDFILLDTAAGMGAPFTAASTVADKALLVLTPDPVALRDGKIVADRLLAGGRPQSAVRLVMNRVRRESFGKNAAVADLDECIDTVGVQLLAVIPESRVLQLAGANGTVPPAADPAVVAGQAMAKRLCGQRVPLTF